MNKINPLILISTLIFILLVTIFSISHLENKIKDAANAIFTLDNDAKRIVSLRKTWDKTNLEERLRSTFIDGTLNDKGKTFEIKATSITYEQANDMTKRVLVEAFEIEKIGIISESKERVSFSLEVAK
ncbi:MAG: hypothetical protein LBD84_07220 [Campylobacteraceae bacterium]|jgi:hypothetical protein|nr:hypothetical protein [Campylobacteraceae bacterium]